MKVKARALAKTFAGVTGTVPALGPLDLAVRDGEFVCIVGPSGCGKTTLLRILSQLDEASSGTYTIARNAADKPLSAMVFQGNWLFPWFSVGDNIQYGLRLRGVSRDEREATSRRLLEMIGLARFTDSYPHQLSEGMRQRVSLARALAVDPEVLLMDEPFGALDEQTRLLLQQELIRIWEQNRTTVLFVTHSIDEAIVLADRVLVMSAAPGMILKEIAVPFERPRSVIGLKSDPQFGSIVATIWDSLGGEVMRVRERELRGA